MNPFGICGTSWGSVFCFFVCILMICHCFSCIGFMDPSGPLFGDFDRFGDGLNRHRTLKSEALVEARRRFLKNHVFLRKYERCKNHEKWVEKWLQKVVKNEAKRRSDCDPSRIFFWTGSEDPKTARPRVRFGTHSGRILEWIWGYFE